MQFRCIRCPTVFVDPFKFGCPSALAFTILLTRRIHCAMSPSLRSG